MNSNWYFLVNLVASRRFNRVLDHSFGLCLVFSVFEFFGEFTSSSCDEVAPWDNDQEIDGDYMEEDTILTECLGHDENDEQHHEDCDSGKEAPHAVVQLSHGVTVAHEGCNPRSCKDERWN